VELAVEKKPEDGQAAAFAPSADTENDKKKQGAPQSVSFSEVAAANRAKTPDANGAVAQNPSGVFALQQEAKKGANPELQRKRAEFERRVAIRSQKNPEVKGALDEMCQKAVSMVIKLYGDVRAQQDAIAKLGGGKFVKPEDAPDFNGVVKMLQSGSIREKMNIITNFQETIGQRMLVEGPEKLKQAMEAAEKEKKDKGGESLSTEGVFGLKEGEKAAEFSDKNFNDTAARAAEFRPTFEAKETARKAQIDADLATGKISSQDAAKARLKVPDTYGRAMLNPVESDQAKHETFLKAKNEEHDTKLPAMSLAKLNEPGVIPQGTAPAKEGKTAGLTAGAEASSLVQSTKKMANPYEAEGVRDHEEGKLDYSLDLSETEKALQAKKGKDTVPWIEGEKANILDDSKDFVKDAKSQSMPLKSGVSGTTFRMMETAKLMGVDNTDAVKMACVGMLQPIEAHSFHEIATAAKGFGGEGGGYDAKGFPYNEKTMAPIPVAELEQIAHDCGTTLAELNSMPAGQDGEQGGSGSSGQTGAAEPPSDSGSGKAT
jgi:hypothetical protein